MHSTSDKRESLSSAAVANSVECLYVVGHRHVGSSEVAQAGSGASQGNSRVAYCCSAVSKAVVRNGRSGGDVACVGIAVQITRQRLRSDIGRDVGVGCVQRNDSSGCDVGCGDVGGSNNRRAHICCGDVSSSHRNVCEGYVTRADSYVGKRQAVQRSSRVTQRHGGCAQNDIGVGKVVVGECRANTGDDDVAQRHVVHRSDSRTQGNGGVTNGDWRAEVGVKVRQGNRPCGTCKGVWDCHVRTSLSIHVQTQMC